MGLALSVLLWSTAEASPDGTCPVACISFTEDGGPCLETTIDLQHPGDSGALTIVQDDSVLPTQIRFELLVASCVAGDVFQFTLNGQALGSFPAPPVTAPCLNTPPCSPGIQTFTVSDPAVLGTLWDAGGMNTYGIQKVGTGSQFAWARLVIVKPEGTETQCLVDDNGGSCGTTDLCIAGSSNGTFALTFSWQDPFTHRATVAEVPFDGSQLPSRIDLSSLEDRDYDLCVTAYDDGPGSLYAAAETGELEIVDVTTGQGPLVGKLPINTLEIEYDPSTHRAYSQNYASTFGYEFDVRTARRIGPFFSMGGEFHALEWIGNQLYGANVVGTTGPSELRILQIPTGQTTLVAPLGRGRLAGLAYDQATGTLYGADFGTDSGGNLLRIDPITGAVTVIGPLGFEARSLEFGPDGNLYGAGFASGVGNGLYRVDRSIGHGVRVGSIYLSRPNGLMLVPPLPRTDCQTFTRAGESQMTINGAACEFSPSAVIAGGDTSIECTSPSGAPAILDGSGSTDPDDTIVNWTWFENEGGPAEVLLGTGSILGVQLPLGGHAITLRVTDEAGNTGTETASIDVVDTTAPTLSVTLSPGSLWPPNHRMVEVHAEFTALDACGAVGTVLESVGSSELDDAPGGEDGHTLGDIAGVQVETADDGFQLRAERSRSGDGRTYTAVYRATDGAWNIARQAAVVVVPHDKGGTTDPVSLQLSAAAGVTWITWAPVPEATGYHVLRAGLENLRLEGGAIRLGPVACLAASTVQTSQDDAGLPFAGFGFGYLVEYDEEGRWSSYGAESTGRETIVASEDNGCP